MTTANQNRRNVMLSAWRSKRAEPARTFADCLRAAWRWVKRMAAEAERFRALVTKAGGKVRLSPSLIQSPIGRRIGYGSRRDWSAAYTTAAIGQ